MLHSIISSFSLYLFSIVYAVYFRSTLKVAVKRPGCVIEYMSGQMRETRQGDWLIAYWLADRVVDSDILGAK